MAKQKQFHVYVIRNTRNAKHYAGQTIYGYAKRWQDHLNTAAAGSEYAFHRAIRKHGEAAFELVELWEFEEERHLSPKERAVVEQYASFGSNGYNMTPGGEVRPMQVPEVAAKLRGKNNPMYGKRGAAHPRFGTRHSTESRLKMSATRKASAGGRGEAQGSAKLTTLNVQNIRTLVADVGLSRRQVAKIFGVSNVLIGKIVSRQAWAHVA